MTALDRLRRASPGLSVGLFSADLAQLSRAVERLERTETAALHFDVMDGVWTPHFTGGPAWIKAIRTRLFKDVHLLVAKPEDWFEPFIDAGADLLSFHLEACADPLAALRRLADLAATRTATNGPDPGGDRGLVRGVALNPSTEVASLRPLLPELELVVLLAVDPTRKKMELEPLERVSARAREARELIRESGREVLLCLDGGVKRANIASFARMEPDLVVSGSAVFDGDPEANVGAMLAELRAGRSGP